MIFDIERSIAILERTPAVLHALLYRLDETWTAPNEGPETWSPYDIVGHLIHGEQTDWIPRLAIIFSEQPERKFVPFDRFAMFENSKGKSINQLIDEFTAWRKENVALLKKRNISRDDLSRTGIHPAFGEVTLSQLLSTWVVHDLNHISQIVRVMAKQYKEDVGPWVEYLRILRE